MSQDKATLLAGDSVVEERKTHRYRAFIAYSHSDRRRARWLHRRLEHYRVPHRLLGRSTSVGWVTRRLTPVFRDREELASADDLGERIDRALDESEALIVVCSPAAARSRWVNEEVLRFKRRGRSGRILCLIVDGEPFASEGLDAANHECFPPALRYRLDDEGNLGTEAAEPLAADLRDEGDGRRIAFLKLVAGLLGVDVDELRRREWQRRNRRWAAVTGMAIVIMAATSLLAFEATVQRNNAEHQRAEAEGLVTFMLGNLRAALEPVGRLDLLDMIGKRALAYYAAQDPGALGDESLASRAHALLLIGQVYDLRGKLDEALEVFERAERTTARLLALDPDDPKRIYNHAQSVYWVGYIAWQRGELDLAERKFRRYQALAQQLVAIDPDKAKWQTELEYSWSNLGTLLLAENKVAEAADAFRKALGISIELARHAPSDDASRQFDLAQSRAWLADVALHLGRLEEAYDQRTRELAIYGALLEKNPGNTNVLHSQVNCNYALARLAAARGDARVAFERIKVAVAIAHGLVVKDPSNTDWKALAAIAYSQLGEILFHRGQFALAAEAAIKAEGTAYDLIERDSTVVAWQAVLGRTQLLLARLAARDGEHRRTLALVRRSIARISELEPEAPDNKDIKQVLIGLHLVEGDALHALWLEGSETAWKAALAIAGPDVMHGSLDMRTSVAIVYMRLGRTAQAKSIVKHLDDLHYRAPGFVALKRSLASEPAAGDVAHSADHHSDPELQPEGINDEQP
ncbi:MAG: TIR domain-containing protein [Gammaproteobacteria bacterium]|nr:TIR domain-containing protein [Gammaproteobacteria bacterium]